jgi:hypothetical protein
MGYPMIIRDPMPKKGPQFPPKPSRGEKPGAHTGSQPVPEYLLQRRRVSFQSPPPIIWEERGRTFPVQVLPPCGETFVTTATIFNESL